MKVSQGAALAGLPPFIGGLTQVLRLTSTQFGYSFLYGCPAVLVSYRRRVNGNELSMRLDTYPSRFHRSMETQEKWQPLYMVGDR